MSAEVTYYARLMLDDTIDKHTYIPVCLRGARDNVTWVLAGTVDDGTRFIDVFGEAYGQILFNRWRAWRFSWSKWYGR